MEEDLNIIGLRAQIRDNASLLFGLPADRFIIATMHDYTLGAYGGLMTKGIAMHQDTLAVTKKDVGSAGEALSKLLDLLSIGVSLKASGGSEPWVEDENGRPWVHTEIGLFLGEGLPGLSPQEKDAAVRGR